MSISREQKKYLLDIQESILLIDVHLNNERIFSEYLSNVTKRRAVEREISIIGEAMNKLLKLNNEIPISYKNVIVALRNKIIHAYDSIDNELIWKIIVKDIPVLLEEITALLDAD